MSKLKEILVTFLILVCSAEQLTTTKLHINWITPNIIPQAKVV